MSTKKGCLKVGKAAPRKKGGHCGKKLKRSQIRGSRKFVSADRQRKAKRPGKRRSKSGRMYTERRQNRSDVVGSRL